MEKIYIIIATDGEHTFTENEAYLSKDRAEEVAADLQLEEINFGDYVRYRIKELTVIS